MERKIAKKKMCKWLYYYLLSLNNFQIWKRNKTLRRSLEYLQWKGGGGREREACNSSFVTTWVLERVIKKASNLIVKQHNKIPQKESKK